jgi:magnesium transporter
MSADQQADLFRELPDKDRSRLLKQLDAPTQHSLRLLLRYAPDTAGGIMTTEFVSMPTTWTVERALAHIGEVGGAKETVYAIYVLAPDTQQLDHVVSLRELVLADRNQLVGDVGDRRTPIMVTPLTDREEVARLISKYNLLAVPVVDEGGHVLGIVTVDDVIDAIVREQTEDVQKFGGDGACWRRDVRLARGLDAALPASPTQFRPGQRLGAVSSPRWWTSPA